MLPFTWFVMFALMYGGEELLTPRAEVSMFLYAVLLQFFLIRTKIFAMGAFKTGGVFGCEMASEDTGFCGCRPGAFCTYVLGISGINLELFQLEWGT